MKFYAGGFLWDSERQAVLLHKRDNKTAINPNKWAFFGGLGESGEAPIQAFVREMGEELGILVELSKVKPLRNYFNPERGARRYVFYVESSVRKEDMRLGEGKDFDWFLLEDAFKLDLTESTRRDLLFFQNAKS